MMTKKSGGGGLIRAILGNFSEVKARRLCTTTFQAFRVDLQLWYHLIWSR
jgi:hypothetical protein